MTVERPPWHHAAALARSLHEGAAALSVDDRGALDQLQAHVRNRLDTFGVSVTDEWAVFHGLAFLSLVNESAIAALKNGRMSQEVAAGVSTTVRHLALALVDYVPPEVCS